MNIFNRPQGRLLEP